MRKDESLRLRRSVNELFIKKDCPNDPLAPCMVCHSILYLHGLSPAIKI
jgi:hypothetical protein